MGFIELFLLALGLAMDAFAVSICKGLAIKNIKLKHYIIIALWFGIFQALMPVIGYYLGIGFKDFITSIDHWIAFILLSFIGGKMIKDSFSTDKEATDDSISFKKMIILAIATSIDALAIGITFAFLDVSLFSSVALIGTVTFILSLIGTKIGHVFGIKYKSKAELLGGIILCSIGLKILIEHLFF